jgi:type II secretion system protein H
VRRLRHGFTLIELIAVVAIFALLAAMVAPAFDLSDAREVRREAEHLGDAIEFARQRAITSGRVHRVWIDLDGRRHGVEWEAPLDAEAEPEPAPRPGEPRRIALVPPPEASGASELVPVPGPFGREHRLADEVRFADVRFPGAVLDHGEVYLLFGPDGSAEPALLALTDAEGSHLVEVEVEALADPVRISELER